MTDFVRLAALCKQQTATDCNRLQQTATDCNRLQKTATNCNRPATLTTVFTAAKHVSTTDCNRLRQTATDCNTPAPLTTALTAANDASHCNRLQQTATDCNILQHTCAVDDGSHSGETCITNFGVLVYEALN